MAQHKKKEETTMEEQLQKLRDQVATMKELAALAPDLETSKEISLKLTDLLSNVVELVGRLLAVNSVE